MTSSVPEEFTDEVAEEGACALLPAAPVVKTSDELRERRIRSTHHLHHIFTCLAPVEIVKTRTGHVPTSARGAQRRRVPGTGAHHDVACRRCIRAGYYSHRSGPADKRRRRAGTEGSVAEATTKTSPPLSSRAYATGWDWRVPVGLIGSTGFACRRSPTSWKRLARLGHAKTLRWGHVRPWWRPEPRSVHDL